MSTLSHLIVLMPFWLQPTLAFQGASKSAPPSLDPLAQKYSITIEYANIISPIKLGGVDITAEVAPNNLLAAYIPILVSEFGRYPVAFVQKAKLQRIVLCRSLAVGGQRRNAVPDSVHDTLYLEVERGASNQEYLRKVIHHEFFHMVDQVDDGKLYGDPEWEKLNLPSFKYGSGGKNVQNISNVGQLSETYPGFLNAYSTAGVEEDKAEIFAYLMINPAAVEARTRRDQVIQAKVQHMRLLLTRFCPEIDETLATEPKSKAKSRTKK